MVASVITSPSVGRLRLMNLVNSVDQLDDCSRKENWRRMNLVANFMDIEMSMPLDTPSNVGGGDGIPLDSSSPSVSAPSIERPSGEVRDPPSAEFTANPTATPVPNEPTLSNQPGGANPNDPSDLATTPPTDSPPTADPTSTDGFVPTTEASTQAPDAGVAAAPTQAPNAGAPSTAASTQAPNAGAPSTAASTQAPNAGAPSTAASTQAPNAGAPSTAASTQAPNANTSSEIPGISPTQAPIIASSRPPSVAPTVTAAPTGSASPTPVPTDSASPTDTASPSFEITDVSQLSIYACGNTGVEVVPIPAEFTEIQLEVEYQVESLLSFEDAEDDIERMIVESALRGALQCSGLVAQGTFRVTSEVTEELCLPQVDFFNDCQVVESSVTFLLVGEDLDPEVARFLAYVGLQRDMATFDDDLDDVDRVEYINPLPLLPPALSTPQQSGEPVPLSSNNTVLSVTPYTVGAVVAMCIGGIVAMWVWARNRRTRHQRHMHLLEENSFVSPDGTGGSPA